MVFANRRFINQKNINPPLGVGYQEPFVTVHLAVFALCEGKGKCVSCRLAGAGSTRKKWE